jgi:hypothetical protein
MMGTVNESVDKKSLGRRRKKPQDEDEELVD